MSHFNFSDADPAGFEILEAIGNADQFNRWMYHEIRPSLKGKVLEIGSGTGNISSFCLDDFNDVVLSDVRDSYCNYLRNKFKGRISPAQVRKIDLSGKTDDDSDEMKGMFDSIFALNVIEHVQDDETAVRKIFSLLKPGGTFCMLVPAYQSLYNGIDKNLQHFRRYSKEMVERLLTENGFEVMNTWSFNSLGILAWWWSGKVAGSVMINNRQMGFYNTLVPLVRVLDEVTFKKLGLSVICTARKPD